MFQNKKMDTQSRYLSPKIKAQTLVKKKKIAEKNTILRYKYDTQG